MTENELNKEITSVEVWRKSLLPEGNNSASLVSSNSIPENAATLARQSLDRLTRAYSGHSR